MIASLGRRKRQRVQTKANKLRYANIHNLQTLSQKNQKYLLGSLKTKDKQIAYKRIKEASLLIHLGSNAQGTGWEMADQDCRADRKCHHFDLANMTLRINLQNG